MSDLPPGLRDFGVRLEEAADRELRERRRLRRRRRARSFGLPVIAALVAAAVSAGAAHLVDRAAEPIKPERGHQGDVLAPAKDPAVVVSSATKDPSGGPPWVVRAYTNVAGRECVQVGRLRGGVFGQIVGGAFRALPASAHGTCAVLPAGDPLFAVDRYAPIDRTLVFGLVPGRDSVTVRMGREERTVRPAGLGAFVVVFAGVDPDQPIVARSKVGGRTQARRVG